MSFPFSQFDVAVMGGFCWGCVQQGAIPDFPYGFALTPFLSRPHDNGEQLVYKAVHIDPAVGIILTCGLWVLLRKN